ncbi:4'-phosphopantetheinyl transferase superfamily protein [Streptomyces sp. NPDC050095]|uniref:4'-phosphopantetheinyl transferase family protein n=1 Tax=unclassified Streptomyces TaxID=2593676 RepID=UPI003423EDB8
MSEQRALPGPGSVDLWLLAVPGPGTAVPAREYALLDGAERRRARGFATPGGRDRYVRAHLLLRHVLARYVEPDAAALRFGRELPHGRPVLRGLSFAPHFSLSHSHGLAAVAVASAAVGVDVQRICPPGTVEACLSRLHPIERAELELLGPAERTRAFSRLWSRKEAYLKGLGTGLSRPPRADFLGDTDRASRPPGWSVRDVPAPSGYAAATALRAEEPHRVTVRTAPPTAGEEADSTPVR